MPVNGGPGAEEREREIESEREGERSISKMVLPTASSNGISSLRGPWVKTTND